MRKVFVGSSYYILISVCRVLALIKYITFRGQKRSAPIESVGHGGGLPGAQALGESARLVRNTGVHSRGANEPECEDVYYKIKNPDCCPGFFIESGLWLITFRVIDSRWKQAQVFFRILLR
jgi:hypothetical protein